MKDLRSKWPIRAGENAEAFAPKPENAATPGVVIPIAPEVANRRAKSSDTLGIAWLHGALHVTVFRRQNPTKAWFAPEPVHTPVEFAAALDRALVDVGFTGTEVFLILAHDQFVHQTETAPSFSESAARTYLRTRVERLEKDGEPMLWVSQRATAAKKEATYIIHLLPVAFYNQFNGILLARRLDLTRILPLHVPLQLALATLTATRDLPLLVAAEAGDATAVLVGRAGGDVLFSRTILESWKRDAARVAVEINRSLLYAKQQFGATVDFVWLLGRETEAARAEVATKCGKNTEITVEQSGPAEWLRAVAKLTHRHPINLVGSFLRKKRRNRFLRRFALAACWLGLGFAAANTWTSVQSWKAEESRYVALRDGEATLQVEYERLTRRNAEFEQRRAFIRTVADDRQPPVSEKFLAYIASILPHEARLAEFAIKWNAETAQWEFRLEGSIEADSETAAAMLAGVRRQMTNGPLRAHFVETVRAPVAVTLGFDRSLQQFTLEGGLFAN